MSWPNVYRPHQFKDLHLLKVRQIFLNFLAKGFFPQVLLFTGPKGTGKTTAARILAATLNSPDNQKAVKNIYLNKNTKLNKSHFQLTEPNHNDSIVASILRGQSYCVQELDAASNRGIDEVRLLKDRAQMPPTDGVMAVYILDEAHMLTTPAFNALLKLLEEPPAHAVFVLATTELDKIPDTIKSRCLIVEFQKATVAEIKSAIEKVMDLEKVNIEPDALDLICLYADGSFRDALKYLEICAQTDKNITLKTVESVVTPLFATQAKNLVQYLIQKDSNKVLEIINSLRQQGVEDKNFIGQLVRLLHTTLVEIQTDLPQSLAITEKVCRFLLSSFLNPDLVLASPVPLLRLELLCLDLIDRANNRPGSRQNPIQPSENNFDQPNTPVQKAAKNITSQPIEAISSRPVDNFSSAPKLLEKWEEFLQELSQRNSSLAAFMRSSKPILQNENVLQLQVYYKFHQQQLSLPKFKQMASEAAAALNLTLPELTILLSTPPQPTPTLSSDILEDRPLTEIASELLS